MFITYCCHSSRLQSSSEIDSCLVLQILHLSTQYCNIYLTGSPLACTFNAVVTTWSQNLDNCLARGESANFWTDVFVMFVATFWNNYCMFWQDLCVSMNIEMHIYPPSRHAKAIMRVTQIIVLTRTLVYFLDSFRPIYLFL